MRGMTRSRPRTWSIRRGLTTILLAWVAAGCSLDSLLKSDRLPPDVTDPAITKTRDGALEAYRGTLLLFLQAFGGRRGVVGDGGTFSDELHKGTLGTSDVDEVDARDIAVGVFGTFSPLQQVRGQAGQAIGLLTNYALERERGALTGHVYALEGYAEIMLAELYCSGIPLSTLDFDGNYTLKSGSTTAEVLTHAVALFDTALSLAGDSTRFVRLAAVGKARALLGLGQYASAAQAVAVVPDDYRYEVRYNGTVPTNPDLEARNFFATYISSAAYWDWSVADREGGNGLDYVTSGDPRSAVTLQGTNSYGYPIYYPAGYATDGSAPLVLASGVEAQLIAAEAALQASDASWLTKLNALRTDGTSEERPTADPNDDPAATYTFWYAGGGGVDSLAPLADPDPSAPSGPTPPRVDLLFRERAFWLFLTGHRQGDLRRLIRQYGRTQDSVYPVGSYPSLAPGSRYGDDVTFPIPDSERIANPFFTGCISRQA